MPLDLEDVQDMINVNVNNDVDTPDPDSDDEWSVRLKLIHLAIGVWEGVDVFWDELWTTYTHGSTVTSATTYTPTFTDFRFAASKIRLVLDGATTFIPLVSPEKAQNFEAGSRVAYFTGNNKAGWTLNFRWTPVSGDGTYGATIIFDYYKYAFKPELVTDKFEMSDPNFIVFWVSAQKSLQESQNNKYSIFSGEASRTLEQMKVMNLIGPPESNQINEDLDAINSGFIIGE